MTTSTRIWAATMLALLAFPALALAAEFRTGDRPSLPSGDTLVNDLYMAGGTVTSSGNVKGDLIVGGGTILISGPVSSDVIAGGGNITILSEIGDDVRVGGGNILIQGAVKGDVIAGGGQITISGPGVGGDVAVGGGSVQIDAPVGGKVKIGGGQIVINSPITGNVEIQAEKLMLGEKAVINGTLTYTAVGEMTKDAGAVVKGEIKFTKRADVRDAAKVGFAAIVSLWVISKFFMLLAGSFIISIVFNRFSHELVQRAVTNLWLEVIRGAIFLIVTPIASVILLITVVGVPFGALGLIAFAGALIFTFLASPIVVGSIVHKWIFKPVTYEITWKTIIFGVAISFALDFIPILGGLVKLGIMLIVLGAALNIKWSIAKEWR